MMEKRLSAFAATLCLLLAATTVSAEQTATIKRFKYENVSLYDEKGQQIGVKPSGEMAFLVGGVATLQPSTGHYRISAGDTIFYISRRDFETGEVSRGGDRGCLTIPGIRHTPNGSSGLGVDCNR